jgi:hypothetical protein
MHVLRATAWLTTALLLTAASCETEKKADAESAETGAATSDGEKSADPAPEEEKIAGADAMDATAKFLGEHTMAGKADPILERWVVAADLEGCKLTGSNEMSAEELASNFQGDRYEAQRTGVGEAFARHKLGEMISSYGSREEQPATYQNGTIEGEGCKVESGARFSVYATLEGGGDDDLVGFDYHALYVGGTWKFWSMDATTHDCSEDYAARLGACKKLSEME